MGVLMGIALTTVAILAVVVVVFVGGGIIWGIGHSAGWGKGKKSLPENKRQPYAYLDEDKSSREAIERIARGYLDDDALQMRARAVLSTFEKAELRRKGIFSIMEQEFERDSLTWDKFAAPVDVALEGIQRNATQIVNHMQAFDSQEYQRMDRIEQAGGYKENSNEVARLKLMRETLGEMDALQKKNDRLLVELERLQAELMKLTGSTDDTDNIIEEIQRLSEDAKYYS